MASQPGPRADQIQPSPSSTVGYVMSIGADGKPGFVPPFGLGAIKLTNFIAA